jgi:type VI secretion system secreted protein Hcp
MKNFRACSVVVPALVLSVGVSAGAAKPALADEFTVNVQGRQGPFPVDEAGAAGIEALAVDYQVTVPVALSGGGGGASGKPQHKPLVIRKLPGASSLFFYEAMIKGEHLPEVIIVAKKKGKGGKQQDYLIITIKDALVTSYQTAGGEGDKPSVEEISFVFHTIQLTHPPTGKQVTDSPLGARP